MALRKIASSLAKVSDSSDSNHQAEDYLRISSEFRLSGLPTEQSHPLTVDLSQLCNQENLLPAIEKFRAVELQAFTEIQKHAADIFPLIAKLSETMTQVLRQKKRIHLVGCGATGRLSLALEAWWKEHTTSNSTQMYAEQLVSFMAGGDYALVRSIENFEDHIEYGAQQLIDSGFQPGDLVIGSSEGGETPFVIGAVLKASEYAMGSPTPVFSPSPYFIYCNPDDLLRKIGERCRQVLDNPDINKINLTIGPMAITGSTRLQASSVIIWALGSALWNCILDLQQETIPGTPSKTSRKTFESSRENKAESVLTEHIRWLKEVKLDALENLILAEAHVYQDNQFCLFESENTALTVFTDLTERTPTFSIPPLMRDTEFADNENIDGFIEKKKQQKPWTHLLVPGTANSHEAWRQILHRDPRPLEWINLRNICGSEVIFDFNFSSQSLITQKIKNKITVSQNHPAFATYRIDQLVTSQPDSSPGDFFFSLTRPQQQGASSLHGGSEEVIMARLPAPHHVLHEEMGLKFLLNLISTLVMGKLNRFSGNVMHWVRATNNKLVDRSIRYLQEMLKHDAHSSSSPRSYEELAYELFFTLQDLKPDESVVLKTFQRLTKQTKSINSKN